MCRVGLIMSRWLMLYRFESGLAYLGKVGFFGRYCSVLGRAYPVISCRFWSGRVKCGLFHFGSGQVDQFGSGREGSQVGFSRVKSCSIRSCVAGSDQIYCFRFRSTLVGSNVVVLALVWSVLHRDWR
jgi:hypothetical protein